MSEGETWIVIPNWSNFQHYADRDPTWIKDYVSQLADDDWTSLSLADRGALQVARLMYASADGKLPTSKFARAISFQGSHTTRVIERLSHAGLIEVSASKPLSLARSREKRREEKRLRASTKGKKQGTPKPVEAAEAASVNGEEPDLIADLLDRDTLLAQARSWLDEHDPAAPRREPDPNPFG